MRIPIGSSPDPSREALIDILAPLGRKRKSKRVLLYMFGDFSEEYYNMTWEVKLLMEGNGQIPPADFKEDPLLNFEDEIELKP